MLIVMVKIAGYNLVKTSLRYIQEVFPTKIQEIADQKGELEVRIFFSPPINLVSTFQAYIELY